MEEEKKVFYSDITRVKLEQKNNLYDILSVTPATPVPAENNDNDPSLFEPRCDKYYVPKKRSRLKVRTVRDIRNMFEQDNYGNIIEDMEKQQNVLLTKIRTGSATDDNTKNMAKKLLDADHPISRTTWQMLNNINPERNINPIQFVLLNGKRIRVVGSRGGKTKFISNHDLGKKNIEKNKNKRYLENNIKRKHRLLRDSLNVKFKPGPLQRKENLDDSHQKYHMGPIELVKLPKPAVDIQPMYGVVVEPVMSNFINKLRAADGTISEKWAEFTVTALGTIQNNKIVQTDKECCVTFDLKYKCGQNRILMRRDMMSKESTNRDDDTPPKHAYQNKFDNMLEVKTIMNKILDSVEISLKQDYMYSSENVSPSINVESLDDYNTNMVKDKNKKKYGELDRLAVTVIQLPGNPKNDPSKPCGKSYCRLGCICDSLNCTYKFKQHCGYSECMFGCKCEMSKYKDIELLDSSCAELIPGLIKLDNEINANLSKEEQKFHQTVVMSGEKSILLKSRKRNLKSSKKYEEFYSHMRLKNDTKPKKILAVVDKKLNCANIEPWCMVHNLYRCFCSGRFTETSTLSTTASVPIQNITINSENSNTSDLGVKANHDIRNVLRPRVRHNRESFEKDCLAENKVTIDYDRDDSSNISCARTTGFIGRKYEDSYYKITNTKILEMEKHDTKLHKKMIRLMKTPNVSGSDTPGVMSPDPPEKSNDVTVTNEKKTKECNVQCSNFDNKAKESDKNMSSTENITESSSKAPDIVAIDLTKESKKISNDADPHIPFEISGDIYKPIKGHLITQEFLTPWIAKSYKNYKQQLINGKSTLERPKRGTIILHLWECLLNRYRTRRNIFLTTTKRPFRIYIATETGKPFFKDCINIDAIRFADLHKYPCVVKKLLTNASNKDYFCILGGWDDCWEIMGSVKKNESESDDQMSGDADLSNAESTSQHSDYAEGSWSQTEPDDIENNSNEDHSHEVNKSVPETNNSERSKWFLMKLENDFTEIYCHKKGFYVEREKILHAIDLARITRKTVVINKQEDTETTNIPFGIYALPIMTEFCAFVGPYEIDEVLGLEIVRASCITKKRSTKGFWITTNKVDNIKVLDDPMSLLPPTTVKKELCNIIGVKSLPKTYKITDGSDYVQPSTSGEKMTVKKSTNHDVSTKETSVEKKSKTVKPIKIRRTNGFYHLTSKSTILKKVLPKTANSLVNAISQNNSTINAQNSILINDPKSLYTIAKYTDGQVINSDGTIADETNTDSIFVEHETDAPQIKITSVFSQNENEIAKRKADNKSGMLILKPDEINKKASFVQKCLINEDEITTDIEHFLTNPSNSASINDCVILSDSENVNFTLETETWTEVWIQCSNMNNLGWIRGKRNKDNLLRIDYPGFSPTTLYTESAALDKINEIMSSRIDIPENVKLNWRVLNSTNKKPASKYRLLRAGNGSQDLVTLTKLAGDKTASSSNTFEVSQLFEDPPNSVLLNSKSSHLIQGLEQTSRLLEDESLFLWNRTENSRAEIIRAIKVPDELRTELTEDIQDLKTMNDALIDE